ncbi:uncharacterized protein LOC127130411 [Lathyrus oleraceus]|uniref:uncharacterized protein LOC127130411 n=1 Tax=Pisum sativum TaxID=3888 RepID=UPI0021D3A036|nr:uncharacterized protein LOC127130411 [Pisum sativum]
MGSDKKNTLPLKFKLPRVDTLLALSSKITSCKKNNFIYRYRQIMDLLTTYVDVSALVALSQYYDPPLKLFTFKYFQLVPTIEEYKRLLGWYVKDHPPFTKLGELLMPKSVVEALHIFVEEVTLGLGPRGFSRKFLEEKAWALEKEGKWFPFSATLAFLTYGLVLFPSDDDYKNLFIISAFVSGNPIHALVSDVYYFLHTRHKKRKGVVIMSCGDFPNVPLMGPRGCINYNPLLAMRQLGYLMENELKAELLKDVFLPGLGEENPNLLQKIKQAWTQIHRKGKELGKRDCRAKESYRQWVVQRVKEVKLPYNIDVQVPPPELEPIDHFSALKNKSLGWLNEKARMNGLLDTYAGSINLLQPVVVMYQANYDFLVRFCNELTKEVPWKLEDALEDAYENTTPYSIL